LAALRRKLTADAAALDTRLEFYALRRDGHEFPVELTISAMRIDDRWEFHAFVRDISDRKAYEAERDELIIKLNSLARTDDLTGLYNRRGWEEELARELARAARDGEPRLCVAMLDLDAFKVYNDTHGHQAGDELLRAVAQSWQSQLRATVLARYGGEEFAVAFPAWPMDAALHIVERLRSDLPAGQTCSAGLVTWDGKESAADVVGRADDALYEAKRAGRDQTVSPP